CTDARGSSATNGAFATEHDAAGRGNRCDCCLPEDVDGRVSGHSRAGRTMKRSYYTSGIVLLLMGALTWLLMSGMNLKSTRYDNEMRALDDFLRFERGMHREVLTARAGLSRNYDSLVSMTGAVRDALHRLRAAAGPNAPETKPIAALEERAGREFDL